MGKRSRREGWREYFYRKAKSEGYRSRASFKLKQLNERYDLIRRGDVVLDLGAAPGGWLQVAREAVGESGSVLGVDLQPITELPHKNVTTIIADITKPETAGLIRSQLQHSADAIISDVSPSISGVWDVDHARSIELVRAVIRVADEVLTPGGKVLIKVFQGEMFKDFLAEVSSKFKFVKVSKPTASRKGSAEVYLIGKEFLRNAALNSI